MVQTAKLTRRIFLTGSAALLASGCARTMPGSVSAYAPAALPPVAHSASYGAIIDDPFAIPAVPPGVVADQYKRQRVNNPFFEAQPGTIVVDPSAFYLYLIEPNGTAIRYGIGVGRQGFSWSGDAVVQFKRKWPRWKVPAEMIERQPELAKYSVENGGMDPGLDNPLGARALYLFQNGEDTLYRIHGTPEAWSIGKAVSSGCIRMLNHDVIDLHDRVANGARVIVRPSNMPGSFA